MDLPNISLGTNMACENIDFSLRSDMDQYIKSEITFEEETITDTKFLDLPMEMVGQVEVGSNAQNVDICFPINNIGEMCELQRTPEEKTEELNDSEISDALNDHNYTSQEVVLSQPKLDSLKDVLLTHIFSNGQSVETLPVSVSNFIDNTISKIKALQLEYLSKNSEENLQNGCLLKDNSTNLPITCSEPLEIEPYDEYFENLYNNISENKTKLNTFLVETKDCAKEIYNESSLQQTEEEFKSFIMDKIVKLKKIVHIINTNEQSVQTSSSNLYKKRHRLNYKAKRCLQDSSDSSDMKSDVSCAESKKDSSSNRSSQCLKKKEFNRETAYDDGIDLSKFIKFETSNSKFRQLSPELKSDISPYTSDDNTDKEIERLTNLSGLKKRHVINGTSKLTNKRKPKKLNVKDENSLNAWDVDLESNDTESIKESDEEVITEDQYLSRYNEQIKNELLNESNSDSGLSDQSEYNISKESSSSDNEAKTCVVDKFLEVFKSENEEDIKDEGNTGNKSEVEQKESDSYDVSDELLNDSSIQKKRYKKSLEKIRSEAEKRNHDEEIVLSSESEFSEVEPEPQQEKNRLIKPMLRLDQLANETRVAQKSETDRIRRLEKKHVILSKAIKNSSSTDSNNSLILDYIEKTKTFIKVDEDILKYLKPHQIDGVKFMYDSCYGGIDHTKKNSGSGCILAHCMGLGKTLQLIALLHTVFSYKELNTTKVLVLCPKSTVMNWADEMQRWLSPLKRKTHIKVFVFPDSSDISDKLRILEEWSVWSINKAGALLVGYEAFRTLVFYHSYKNRGNLSSAQLENIRDKVNKYLLQPGADLVVCDEGHVIKNSKSAISLAVAKIITPKRIMLTGTPIQNHLKEYYSMVNFIKPLYLGTEKEFANLYCNPIKNGQHKDSSKKDITVMKQRSFVLHKKLSKFVQRKEAELLQTFLPQKFEYVLFIPMTTVQNTLYEYILEAIASRGDSRGKSLITDYTVLRKIWTHPKVLEDAWKNANMQKNKKDIKKLGCPNSDDDQPDDIYDSQTGLISVNNDWWRKYLTKKDLETIMPSNKLRTVFSILRMCEDKGEKCLIFSAFVAVLNVVEYFFKKITQSDPEILQHLYVPSNLKAASTWISGQDYYRLDGKTPKNIRHEMIKRFNSEANKRARVFLISAKAGGQGINLIGANRVIILDTSWNPSNDQQNIFRIFRLGQKKNCYIYRLIAMGTMEEKVYSRSVTKQAMSFRVVDEQQIDRHYNMAELAELYTLTYPKQSERPYPLLPKDTILAHLLRQSELVYKYHEHDSLLENKVEQELSEQEKADAWDTYERELQMNLAQQEGANAEKIPNSALPLKHNSYFGSVPPNLDMQALLNYSLQSSTIMPPYNYGLNQNYLDYLNLYQKCSSLRYPDINSCLNDNSLAASLFGVGTPPNLNHMQSTASILSSMQALSSSKAHPKDFSMFDLQKNRTNSIAHSPLHPTTSTEANANLNSIVSSLGQYKQLLENPLGGLLNYSNPSYPTPGQTENLLANMKASLPSDLYPEKILEAGDSINKKDKPARTKSSVDQSIVNKDFISQDLRSTNTIDLTPTSAASLVTTTPFDRNILPLRKQYPLSTTSVDLTTTTPVKNLSPAKRTPPLATVQHQINLSSDEDRHHKSQKSGASNFPSGFPVDKGSSLLSKSFPKTDMQIIPTNSPPGTISITKQLNEMSPSISLTAVNPTNEKSKTQSQLLDKIDKLQNNLSTVSSVSSRQGTANVFKPKPTKPSNPNIFSLSKAVSNVPFTSTTTQKIVTGNEKSLPGIVSQTKKIPKEYSSMLRSDIVKNAPSKPESLSSSMIGTIDPQTLNQKLRVETGLSITKSIAPSQMSNTHMPENVHNMKAATGTIYSSTPVTNIRTTKAISGESGYKSSDHRSPNIANLQGANHQNLAKKRPSESAGNLSIKRTKM